MATPSKPTSTTKFEQIEKVWDEFAVPWVDDTSFDSRPHLRSLLTKLSNGGIVFSLTDQGNKDFAVIGGCIMLAEDMSDE